MTRINLPELLAPAGNWTMLRAAVEAGCDAVYFGLKTLNMRATANNFEISEFPKVVEYCHENKVRAHMTLNIILYEDELEKAEFVIKEAKKANVDAIICWDLSVIRLCKKHNVPFHISTQASIANSESALFYKELGAERVILARECNLEQIKALKEKVKDLPVETFIHGAMCVAVSGRCFMSQFAYCKSANRGDCIQPCRRSYTIIDKETGKEFGVENNYIMSAKDLCTMPILDKLVDAGIDSFKIEGRAKAPEYVKTVVSCYRKALDAIAEGIFTEDLKKELYEELKTVFNRDFSFGFYLGNPGADGFYNQYGPQNENMKVYVGRVRNYFRRVNAAEIKLETRGISIGDNLMVQGPTTGVKECTVNSLQRNNESISEGKKGDRVGIEVPFEVRPSDKVFIIKKES